jgi:hypothetical protein
LLLLLLEHLKREQEKKRDRRWDPSFLLLLLAPFFFPLFILQHLHSGREPWKYAYPNENSRVENKYKIKRKFSFFFTNWNCWEPGTSASGNELFCVFPSVSFSRCCLACLKIYILHVCISLGEEYTTITVSNSLMHSGNMQRLIHQDYLPSFFLSFFLLP